MMKHIKLDMRDYKTRQREAEKIDRLFDIAEKIGVCVGNERKQYGRDPRFLSKKP